MTQIHFFWMVEYDDEKFFPQFDFKTGKENLYKEVKLDKIKKIGWYPFTVELSKKVSNSIFDPFLSYYVLVLKKEDKLIIRRRGYIEMNNKKEKKYYEYILGTQNYAMIIDIHGNVKMTSEYL